MVTQGLLFLRAFYFIYLNFEIILAALKLSLYALFRRLYILIISRPIYFSLKASNLIQDERIENR